MNVKIFKIVKKGAKTPKKHPFLGKKRQKSPLFYLFLEWRQIQFFVFCAI